MAFLYLLCSAVVSLLAASPHFGAPAAATARFGATTAAALVPLLQLVTLLALLQAVQQVVQHCFGPAGRSALLV